MTLDDFNAWVDSLHKMHPQIGRWLTAGSHERLQLAFDLVFEQLDVRDAYVLLDEWVTGAKDQPKPYDATNLPAFIGRQCREINGQRAIIERQEEEQKLDEWKKQQYGHAARGGAASNPFAPYKDVSDYLAHWRPTDPKVRAFYERYLEGKARRTRGRSQTRRGQNDG